MHEVKRKRNTEFWMALYNQSVMSDHNKIVRVGVFVALMFVMLNL